MTFRKWPVVLAGLSLIGAALTALVACGGSSSTNSSITPPISSGPAVQNVVTLSSCPANGFFQYTDSAGTNHPMNCSSAEVSGCPNAQDMDFTFGTLSPSGIIPGTVKGVVVFFDGADGTQATDNGETDEFDMLTYYFENGYEIVQLAWSSAWEATYNPFPTGTFGNIHDAACRPATFLSYVNTNIFPPLLQANPEAGMCAQGVSAGTTQILYSMAFYGAANYLDNVELISGPVLSNIELGCEEPPAAPVTICPAGQYGCELGSGTSWTLGPTYLDPAYQSVGAWTNDNSCGVPNTTTTSTSNSQWLQQSIVNGGLDGLTFNYPNTAMAAWLCRSVQNPNNVECATNYDGKVCPNNSSPQAELFYSQITQANSPPVYKVVAVDQCESSEGSPHGNVGSPTGPLGEVAIEQDMAGAPGVTAQCFRRSH
jgi:hypothetical protein